MEILKSLSNMHILLQIGNLSQWSLERKTWTMRKSWFLEVYTIIVIICSAGFLIYDIFRDTHYSKIENEIGHKVDFIQIIGIRVAHLVSITEAMIRRNEQLMFIERVAEIDRIFERALNVNVDNSEFRRGAIRRGMLMLSIYLIAEIFILTIKIISSDEYFVLFCIFYLLPFLICGLRYFQIQTSISIIKWRFDKLIDTLKELNFTPDTSHDRELMTTIESIGAQIMHKSINLKSTLDLEEAALKRLLIMRDIYNRLWELSVIVNRSYGVSMLINIGNDFISITSHCYWIFLNFKRYASTPLGFLEIIGSVMWSVPHVYNLLLLAITCEHAIMGNNGIALSLHRLEVDVLNDHHNTVISQFSLQLLHQKLTFTAAGFFSIDCTLLYTIVGATTTYLIILIQFHLTEYAK